MTYVLLTETKDDSELKLFNSQLDAPWEKGSVGTRTPTEDHGTADLMRVFAMGR